MSDLIDRHIAWLRAAGRSRRTIEDREGVLRRADAALPLGVELSEEDDLTLYLGNERWMPATRDIYWRHLFGFYAWAMGRHLAINPMDGMPRPPSPPGEPRPVTPEQLAHILTHAANPWWLCAVFAAGAGLRCQEIAALMREDITEEKIYIAKPKGGRRASVPTAPEIWGAVRDFPGGSLVAQVGGIADGRWISTRSATYFRRQLGMAGVGLHRLRHTYAKILREQGHDAFVIKDLMRHSSLRTTQRYVGATEAECRLAVNALRFLPRAAS